MAKTVFGTHAQTAHVWAQGRGGDTGRGRSSDDRMSFNGRILYSYGTHYALGLVINGTPKTYLVNGTRHSVSTSKHLSHTYRATGYVSTTSVPNLTAIVDSLEYVTGEIEGGKAGLKAVQARHRAKIESHIAKNWAEYSDESAAVVLGLVGGTAKQAAALRAKAAKAAAAKQAAEDKQEHLAKVGTAKIYAKMTDSEFRAELRSVAGDYAYSAEAQLARHITKLRTYHKAASKAGLGKVKAAMWGKIQLAQSMEAKARTIAVINENNKAAKQGARHLRDYWANLAAAEPKPLARVHWGMVRDAAEAVRNRAKHRPSLENLNAVLSNLARHASEEHDLAWATEQAVAEQAREARRVERERQRQEQLAREATAKQDWLAGDTSAKFYGRTENGGAYLRAIHVEIDGLGNFTGTLQTSLGAEVPLAHALRAFKFLKLCHDNGRAWNANGRTVPVGHFRIDRIAANGDFHAGCHFIEWAQVEALAQRLGVQGWAGDESAVVRSAEQA